MRSLLLLAVLALGTPALSASCLPLALADAQAVREANLAYPAAWRANEGEAVMRLFTRDGVLMPHHGVQPVEGEEAIRNHFWPAGAPPLVVNDYQMEPAEVSGCADLAYSRGRFSIRFTIDREGEQRTFSNEGNYLMVFRKDSGAWRISRFIWNDPIPKVR